MSDSTVYTDQAAPRAGAQTMPTLYLHGVTRAFGEGEERLEIFRNVNAQIMPGEIVALVGPSGSGKSSLLHISGLLEPPTSGSVFINGRDCSKLNDEERTAIRRTQLGYVYQFHHLLPEFNAVENVAMPQMIAGRRSREAEVVATRLLTMVGLQHRLTHRPGEPTALDPGRRADWQSRSAHGRYGVRRPRRYLPRPRRIGADCDAQSANGGEDGPYVVAA
jgi:lipoprotein-releasing system ATP-binding protein